MIPNAKQCCRIVVLSLLLASSADATVNSIGMKFVEIPAGSFVMGQEDGSWDEKPVGKVTISRGLLMSRTEVTNAQYEQFDPAHRKLRGKLGFSKGDDEAVVFVSWRKATAFCRWLSKKESKPYRLPTEAEWEYACRAGTTTPYHTGKTLPKAFCKNVILSWFPRSKGTKDKPVKLTTGATEPNAWGLQDMHGNVEEWCSDWYGPYPKGDRSDPVGPAGGDFKVARGGSHSTTLAFLRSANRSGTLPDDKSWLIGFRVVQGQTPGTKPSPALGPPLNAQNVSQKIPTDLSKGPDPSKPFFKGPLQYVKIPPAADCGVYNRHNHCPAVVNCPNSDLLAIWYTCRTEPGRELGIVASRLPYGANQWQVASDFWDAPDRNDHASALWVDDKGTIYHFNGLSAAATWGSLATIMRTSTDSGATWSKAKLIMPEHGARHMPVESVQRTKEGAIIVPCDAVVGGSGGTAVLMSRDAGETWADPGEGKPVPTFADGSTGAWIAGIHAGFVQLKDGSLMAFGRGNAIDGKMPMSVSKDMGKTWKYSASPFPTLGGGQRLAILRLAEGPILFCSFGRSIAITDASDRQRNVSGLFAAITTDEGKTWSIKRPITNDGPARTVDGGGNTGRFTMSAHSAEPRGYMSICQTPNGVIHLISSKQHYQFNLAWLDTPAPAATNAPPPQKRDNPVRRDIKPVKLEAKSKLAHVFIPDDLPGKTAAWRFTGSGVKETEAVRFTKGGMTIDTGGNQRARWVDTSDDGFARADAKKGFTAESRLQILKSTSSTRGFDLEAHAAGKRYFITITKTAVHWQDRGFSLAAKGLDNHSAMHTYRLSVRPDGAVQIYRDGAPLAARRPASGTDPMLNAHGPYLQWGDGAGGSETDAIVAHVSYDLGGAYQPAK
jgi:formylglycine-generating enzyme required for sulfatase activity